MGERLAEAGIQPSVGAVGSSYDNALAETINGLYKTELIKPRKPWRTVEEVEYATAGWVDWFNHHRLYEYCGDIPPVEMEPPTALERRDQSPAEFIKESLRTRRAVQAWQRVKSTCSQSCDAVETSRTASGPTANRCSSG